eukprot:gene8749-biopygen15191
MLAARVSQLATTCIIQGEQDSGAGVARAWRGRGAGYRHFLAWGGAGVARAWRGRGVGISCSPRGPKSMVFENRPQAPVPPLWSSQAPPGRCCKSMIPPKTAQLGRWIAQIHRISSRHRKPRCYAHFTVDNRPLTVAH